MLKIHFLRKLNVCCFNKMNRTTETHIIKAQRQHRKQWCLMWHEWKNPRTLYRITRTERAVFNSSLFRLHNCYKIEERYI